MSIAIIKRLKTLAIELLFIPFESYNNIHAAMTAFKRLIFTKKHLLQWNTSASYVKMFAALSIYKMLAMMWFVPSTMVVIMFVMLSRHNEMENYEYN